MIIWATTSGAPLSSSLSGLSVLRGGWDGLAGCWTALCGNGGPVVPLVGDVRAVSQAPMDSHCLSLVVESWAGLWQVTVASTEKCWMVFAAAAPSCCDNCPDFSSLSRCWVSSLLMALGCSWRDDRALLRGDGGGRGGQVLGRENFNYSNHYWERSKSIG